MPATLANPAHGSRTECHAGGVITDGGLTLAPLRLDDAELVRRLNGGRGTLPGVQA
jgi:hypothetical protein